MGILTDWVSGKYSRWHVSGRKLLYCQRFVKFFMVDSSPVTRLCFWVLFHLFNHNVGRGRGGGGGGGGAWLKKKK